MDVSVPLASLSQASSPHLALDPALQPAELMEMALRSPHRRKASFICAGEVSLDEEVRLILCGRARILRLVGKMNSRAGRTRWTLLSSCA